MDPVMDGPSVFLGYLLYISVPFNNTRINYHMPKYLFFPCTIMEWNSLPKDIATLQKLDSFKKALVS